MKKSLKKLALNRETIGKLTDQRLAGALGLSGATCGATCDATCLTWCFVCPSPSQQTNCSLCASDCDTCKTC